MRAVNVRRQWETFDVAPRYRFASSLEHYYIFINREARFCKSDYTIASNMQQERLRGQFEGCSSNRSSDLLGPRASRPQTRRQARSSWESPSNPFSRFTLMAGETPAVPANHLIATHHELDTT